MPAVSYDFSPGDTVFCLTTDNCGVKAVFEAVVRNVNIKVTTPSVTTITYDVTYSQTAGSATVDADNAYPDVDSALTAYRAEVLA